MKQEGQYQPHGICNQGGKGAANNSTQMYPGARLSNSGNLDEVVNATLPSELAAEFQAAMTTIGLGKVIR